MTVIKISNLLHCKKKKKSKIKSNWASYKTYNVQKGSDVTCLIELTHIIHSHLTVINIHLTPLLLSVSFTTLPSSWSLGEICAFNIHGLEAPFEAVVLNGTSGEGQLRARGLVDCESQKEYTFIIQAHDCGSGPGGVEGKKSHKWVRQTAVTTTAAFQVRIRKWVQSVFLFKEMSL